jgi:ABC-2 type transport system permease protein
MGRYLLINISQIVNSLAVAYNIKFLKYFITLNWDFSQYAYGAVPAYKYISLPFSISIYILYILLFIFLTFFIFNKRDIKNI